MEGIGVRGGNKKRTDMEYDPSTTAINLMCAFSLTQIHARTLTHAMTTTTTMMMR